MRLILVLLLFPIFNTFSQPTKLIGTVTDEQGKGIAFATVQAGAGGTITDGFGRFSMDVPEGELTIIVNALGYLQKTLLFHSESDSVVEISLREKIEELNEVIITATRTSRAIDNVPMPVKVIGSDDIGQIGSVRLDEVLREQTGLQIVSDHGSGLQMQGLNSDYILILIDGEPVIGRTAGTLDLRRLAVDNIERVEIIQGPSSSLYGSEAMAGVINIITRETDKSGLSGTAHAQLRSFGTLDAGTSAGYSGDRFSTTMLVNRLSTRGYDLNDQTVSMTAPPFQALTLNPKFSYRFSENVKFSLSGRFYEESQENQTDINNGGQEIRLDENAQRTDWNIMPTLNFTVSDDHQFQIRNYTTGYSTETVLTNQSSGSLFDQNDFSQLFNRTEIQYDWYLGKDKVFTAGAGHILESVEATRYEDVNAFRTGYGFFQFQWTPVPKFNLIAGGRFDAHSEYESRFSPKLALGYSINEAIKVQASFGGGYKAPDFRQLLLNFTNPVAGYTVIGSTILEEQLALLEAQGQIATVFIDPSGRGPIKAESSIGYNLGINFRKGPNLNGSLNFFRNEISNLIDTTPVARKTNGQNVFSYFNFDEVVTQGAEANISFRPLRDLELTAGYQYLDSRNIEDVERIRKGEVYRRDPSTNRTEAVPLSDYGGLPNRSRHSGNAKVMYLVPGIDMDIALRAIWRGKWGLGDSNGNGIIDAENEFAAGYVLLNLGLTKRISGWLTLEGGVNNLLNTTNLNEPSLGGRIWYSGFRIDFSKL